MDIHKLNALLNAQRDILGQISIGKDLPACLTSICQRLEALADQQPIYAAVTHLENDCLYVSAAPNLPAGFASKIDGMQVGPKQGPCGAAVYHRKSVTVVDIQHSELCELFAPALLDWGMNACHSTPIRGIGNVLGTLSVYFPEAKEPDAEMLSVIEFFCLLCSIAMKKQEVDQRENFLHQQLLDHIERFMAFSRVIPDLGLVLDEDGTYVDVYGAAGDLLYETQNDILGKKLSDLLPANVAQGVMDTIKLTLETNKVQLFEYSLEVPKGLVVFEGRTAPLKNFLTTDSNKRHVVWMARDITKRKQHEDKMHHMAFYDALTELPNRRLLFDRLEQMIKRIKRQKNFAALLFIDLDDFKGINDTHGHALGDDYLIAFSKRLEETVRDSDTLGRLGGDEFVILLDSQNSEREIAAAEAQGLCERIVDILQVPFHLQGQEIIGSASLGISIISPDDNSADDVLSFADSAMYQAKKQGKGQAFFYRL